jgi:hexosaminidase
MNIRVVFLFLLIAFTLVGCTTLNSMPPSPSIPTILPTSTVQSTLAPTQTTVSHSSLSATNNMNNLIPIPSSTVPAQGVFVFNETTKILVQPENDELNRIANHLADKFKPTTGFPFPVSGGIASVGNIFLTLVDDSELGDEGYELKITPDSITLAANKPAGLFYGVQTLRQLAPAAIENTTLQSADWEIAAGTIRDIPRFEWRGTMLDVARHFFKVEDVKRYIDVLAHYKINRLHLHLADDQGWRIEIKSWDKLATYGGSTAVGGGAGGYYTQADYQEIVEYAAQHYITIVPEIDMPGHTNAALASYGELNCNDTAPPLFTGTQVGFSSLCIDKEVTYKFVGDVIRELAALTPAPYLHIGGDEAHATQDDDYIRFIERIQEIVQANGKQMVGWEEIAQVKLVPTSIAQQWKSDLAVQAAAQGARVISSPASRAYLDMKYDSTTKLGLDWAGYVDVIKAYDWEPTQELDGVNESAILGVEAPLWSETLETLADVEYMAFPRLIGISEIGWSPKTNRDWLEYSERLASHGARLETMGINFYRSPQVPWK